MPKTFDTITSMHTGIGKKTSLLASLDHNNKISLVVAMRFEAIMGRAMRASCLSTKRE